MHDMFTKQGQSHWLILGHMAFTKNQMYIAAQRTLESGETEGGKDTARSCHWLAVFFLVNEHNNTMKPKAK